MPIKIYNMEQGTPEWFMARRGVPSASNFKKIITAKKWELSSSAEVYAVDLVAEVAQGGAPEAIKSYCSPDMEHGTETEPEARNYYNLLGFGDVTEVGFVVDSLGRFGCSPDGLVGEEGGLELKCPKLSTQAKRLWQGTLPDEYKAQVHGSMIITGRKWWDFMSYAIGLPPFIIRVYPDEFTAALRSCMSQFWTTYEKVKLFPAFAEVFAEPDLDDSVVF